MINLTPISILKPYVIQITGPLIRIVGDRFPWGVKAAILEVYAQIASPAEIAASSLHCMHSSAEIASPFL